jgi:hypothetical protein
MDIDIDLTGVGPVDMFSTALYCGLEGWELYNAMTAANLPESYKELRLGDRTVWSAEKALRHSQKKLTRLVKDIPAGAASIAYEGCGIKESVSCMVGRGTLISTDIVKFFDNIGYNHLYETFRGHGYNKVVSNILSTILTRVDKRGIRTLPQGGVASPFVSNRVSDKFIDPIVRSCIPRDYTYVRYCDNMYISAPRDLTYRKASALLRGIKSQIAVSGFRLHKTHYRKSSTRQKCLGLVLNTEAGVSRRYYDTIKAILFNVSKTSWSIEASKTGATEYHFRRSVLGKAAYVVSNTTPARRNKIMDLLKGVI